MSELSELPNWSGQVLEGNSADPGQAGNHQTPPPGDEKGSGGRTPSGIVLGLMIGLGAGLLLAAVGIGAFWLGTRQGDEVSTDGGDGTVVAAPEAQDETETTEAPADDVATGDEAQGETEADESGVATEGEGTDDAEGDDATAEQAAPAADEVDPLTGAVVLPADGALVVPADYVSSDPNFDRRMAEVDSYTAVRGGIVYLYGFSSSTESLAGALAVVSQVTGPDGFVNEMFVDPDTPSDGQSLIFVDDKVLFEFNSVELDPGVLPILGLGTQLMLFNPTARMEIIARSDAVGSEETNLEISQRRGQAVVDYWVSQGIDSSRMTIDARGEADASESDDDEAAALNRSVEFILTGIDFESIGG